MDMQALTERAAVRMLLRQEYTFWSEIYYSMTLAEATKEMGIQTQATDGRTMWINPEFFSSIPLDQQVAELVHELYHKVLLHCTRIGHRDPQIWNIACDYVINADMKAQGFTIPSDWLLEPKYAGWLAEAVYTDLMKNKKEQEKQGKVGAQGPQMPGHRQDVLPTPGTAEEIEKHEDEVRTLFETAVANAKAMGHLPAGIAAMIDGIRKPAREPWYNHLHRYMQSLRASEYNWARLNRRTLRTHGLFTPLHYSEALGDVVLAIDTSGSCFSKAMQANFSGHLNAILAEAKPNRIHLYYFDARVYPGETIEAGELDIKTRPRGGGGTSFVPIFAQLEADGIVPEVCIVLTDLMGGFPAAEPEYPVVWASIKKSLRAPFGETIYVE